MNTPTYLYRYRSLEGNGLEWAKKSILSSQYYFSNPLAFNDPFDCKPNINLDGTTDKQLKKYLRTILEKHLPEISKNKRKKHVKLQINNPQNDPRYPLRRQQITQDYKQKITENISILCLSEDPKNLLMWSHYANSHRGICLVMDASNAYIQIASPISYQVNRPAINPVKQTYEEMLNHAILTKSTDWSYEREWRIIQYNKSSGLYPLPVDSLRGIIFGAEISKEHREQIVEWSSLRIPTLKLQQAVLSENEFSLNILDC